MKRLFIPFLLITNFCIGQVNLNQGLIAFYPFSGNANDVTANNINGVVNNATLTTDRFGNANSAYYFNGSNAYIQLPYSSLYNFAPQDSFSISVRVLPDQGNSWPAQALVVKSPFHVDFNQSNWNYGTYVLNYKAMSGYAFNSVCVGTTVFTGTPCWYNIVVTYKNGIWRMYVNGVLEASDLTQTKHILQDGPASKINFGRKGDASGDYFKGKMDDVRIYNRVLNAAEAIALTDCVNTTSCNNWLSTPSQGSYVTTGDLDITGNQLTVEAVFNRTAPLNSGLYYGHLVSKHSNSSNVNYALLPNGCEITTTNGYKSTFQSCPTELDKTYHVAMVYDGINLKYYRNGFLLNQVACTGNMIVNDLQTTIAQVAGGGFPPDNQFLGFTNEVRIWNVARTQSELQTYMNNSLPNPTTQTGLKGYYTFDNLLNKQGNAAFNGTLNGASAINATNSNCTFAADSCFTLVSCNNWLRTQAVGQSVTVGDLDVSGNQVTVEANFNCSSFPLTRPDKQEDIVSKHSNTTDINYVLRMDLAGITTTNGQFLTPIPCDNLVTNKTYHVAMVYNGSSLKFYRNGFLMSQIAATGNLVLNNWLTTIGDYAVNNPVGTNFLGYLNEVRIWNVARTQSQLRTYMGASLPNPATQAGLQGYYTFDNLLNKQGNPAWNGTLNGGATINNTNPNCSFVADSCSVTSTSTIINDYTPVLGFNPCDNKLTVENGSAYNVGDTVLLIQMKGAVI
ncbi:MAG: LamG domain-containing protein, partial [Ferruginibacter sp.]